MDFKVWPHYGPSNMVVEIDERDITPIGYQGAAQHTYTRACDGFHETGPCPVLAPIIEVPLRIAANS